MTLFDTYVAIDWSANATPKHGADSIWVAVRDPNSTEVLNIGTRHAATAFVRRVLLDNIGRDRRAFVGWDFPFGYPVHTAEALGGSDWHDVWDRVAQIKDGERNENNRVEFASTLNDELTGRPSPFWGCPIHRETPTLIAKQSFARFPFQTRRGASIKELRAIEKAARAGNIRPKSVWQLGGAGSVGSQALLGIPRVRALRWDPMLAEHSAIWPFETGFNAKPSSRPIALHAEIWPTEWLPIRSTTEVNDRAQVRAVVDGLAHADVEGRLANAFAAPPGATPDEITAALNEEAWMVSAHVLGGIDSPTT